MRWHLQDLRGETQLDILMRFREAAQQPGFDIKDWDHKSPDYDSRRSNKQLKIVAGMLLGRPADLSWEEAVEAVYKAIGLAQPEIPVGPDPEFHDGPLDTEDYLMRTITIAPGESVIVEAQ